MLCNLLREPQSGRTFFQYPGRHSAQTGWPLTKKHKLSTLRPGGKEVRLFIASASGLVALIRDTEYIRLDLCRTQFSYPQNGGTSLLVYTNVLNELLFLKTSIKVLTYRKQLK